MMHRPIEGVVVSAALKRAALGRRIYDDVVLRRRDGNEERLGRVAHAERLGEVVSPGREGRFYFHGVMGAQGLHAFEPVTGATRVAFSMLYERAFALIALLDLVLVAGWVAYDGGVPLLPLMVTAAATSAWAACRGCREAALHDLKYQGRTAAAHSHRRAVLRGPPEAARQARSAVATSLWSLEWSWSLAAST